MDDPERQRITELCSAIIAERDSRKMMKLVEELNAVLEAKQQRLERMKKTG